MIARQQRNTGLLKAPKLGAMNERVRESMTSVVEVKLYKTNHPVNELLFSGTGMNTGVEIGGEIEKLKQTS